MIHGSAAVSRGELLAAALAHFPSAKTEIPPKSPVVVITIDVLEFVRPVMVPLFGGDDVVDVRPARDTRVDVPVYEGCAGDIARVLRAAGRRMTTADILAELARQEVEWSEPKVKAALATMVECGLLLNHRDGNPRGYSLPN